MNDRSDKARSADTESRLLDAVERLCVEKSPSNVTMREIAAAAGLSLGISYRYFDSREALFGVAMDRMAERITAAADAESTVTAVTTLWKVLEEYPAFPRLLTALVLEGRTVSEVMSRHPLARAIARSAAREGLHDPATIAGVTGLMALAGVLFVPTINRAVERDPADARLYEGAAEMMAHWVADRRAPESGE